MPFSTDDPGPERRKRGEGAPSRAAAAAASVAAARDLAAATGSSAFTVQQVVERAGGSLKSFYRHFEGKDDLLLALLEEDSRVGAALLADMIDRHRLGRLRIRAWITGLFRLM